MTSLLARLKLTARLSRERGLTLIELMVTVAVMAIALTIAAPSFSTLLAANRITRQTSDFIGVLNLARSEAVRRAQPVTLLATDTNTYSLGWALFPDANADGAALSATDIVDGKPIRVANAYNGNVRLTRVTRSAPPAPFTYSVSTATDRMYLIFNSRGGIVPTGPAFFKICDTSNPTVNGRIFQVNLVGKITVDSTNEPCP
jgi:type IV fimbrial biogenesis protein FimT